MKGVLIVVLLGLAVVFAVALVVCAAKALRAWRWIRALRVARWEPHTTIGSGGVASVTVRLVARCGSRCEVLQEEDVARVDASSPLDPAAIDAQAAAAAKASSFNLLQGRHG